MNKNSDKQKIQSLKPQIQLLKQKYLKKGNVIKTNQQQSVLANNNSRTQKSKQQQIAAKSTPKDTNLTAIQNDIKQHTPIQLNTNRQNKQNKQIVHVQQKQWTMKQFLQEKNNKTIQANINKQNINFDQDNIQINQNDPFRLNVIFNFNQKLQNKLKQNDLQFEDHQSTKQNNVMVQKIQNQQLRFADKDPVQACKLWAQNPNNSLEYIFDLRTQKQQNSKTLTLKSRNPSFPGIVQHLAQRFIFNNGQVLNNAQKQVAYNMALQYFIPSPQYLSDVLLICLVKIMPAYGLIYTDQIIKKMQYYSRKIIQYKRYVLKDELESFVKCIQERLQSLRIQGIGFSNSCYIHLLLLKPNSNFCHQILLLRTLQNQIQKLAIFNVLYNDNKQNLQSILYLKCIDSLVPLFTKSMILQKVIAHFNEIKVPENLYSPVKSLKLKLIRAADPKSDKRKIEDDKGFTAFMNQKISKVKNSIQSKINTKIKQQIYYNAQTNKFQPANNPKMSNSI